MEQLDHSPIAPPSSGDVLYTRTMVAVAFALLGIATLLRLDMLLAGLESLGLTILITFSHASDLSQYYRGEIVEFWLAAVAWTIAGFWLGGRLFSSIYRAERTESSRHQQSRPIRWSGQLRAGMAVVQLFLFLSIVGPIVAPVDPFAQGELHTTRFSAPLTTGEVRASLELPNPTLHLSSLEQRLFRTNGDLLARSGHGHIAGSLGSVPTRSTQFLFGTDSVGRDVFSRLVYGTRVSLAIGIMAAFFGILLGCIVGFSSGYFGGSVDKILTWVVDVFLSIPSLFLVLIVTFVLGNTMLNLVVALSCSGWMVMARLVRGEVVHLREREFILAARLLGQSSFSIIRHHLVPNILPLIISAAVLQFSDIILGEAALSFLGLGVQAPIPSWGNMIGEALESLGRAWWIALFPGLFLSILMVALHMVGEGIQNALKP
jgi:ABC-type dipeptide/oligopeptide/nickel transport system permease subunit